MADQNPIKYSDLISPDDSIEKLIGQLETLQVTYGGMASSIREQAASISASLRVVSGATEAGRKATRDASDEAVRLERAYKHLDAALSENAKEIARLNEIRREANNYNKNLVKLGDEEIQTREQIAKATYNQLSAQYSLNKAYINNLNAEEREIKANKDLIKTTNEIYEQMKRLQEATGKYSLNVGNYTNSITQAVGINTRWYQGLTQIAQLTEGGLTKGLQTAGTAVASFGKQLLALLANPIVLTIAAITAAFAALSKGISSSEQNTNALARILAPFKRILTEVLDVLQGCATYILKVVEGFETFALALSRSLERLPLVGSALRKVNDALIENIELEKERQAIRNQQRENTAENAKLERDIAYLKNVAAHTQDVQMKEMALRNARRKEEEILRNNIDIAKRNLALKEREAAQNQNDTKTLDELAEARANVYRAETNYFNHTLRLNKQLATLEAKKNKGGSGGGGGKNTSVDLLKQQIEETRKLEDARIALIEDSNLRERMTIIASYQRKIEDLKGSEQYITQMTILLEQQKQQALADLWEKEQKAAADKEKKDLDTRLKATDTLIKKREEAIRNGEAEIARQYELDASYAELEQNENRKTDMRLKAEKKRLQALLDLYQKDGKILTDVEVQTLKNSIAQVDQEIEKNTKGKDIYDLLGLNLDDDKKQAISDSFAFALDNLSEYLDAWVQAAEKKAQIAEQEVERAKSVVDSEIEARNKGYASNVAEAQKELELAKRTQQKALQEQQRAQKAQQALASVQQATNLISASALIWSQLGFPWAIPAIAVMWGSFAAAKIKAAQVTSMGDEEYGEGTVELLEGGSHQSGNDVDLGRKKNGQRRRAEGGEYFAVINKRNSRRFRHMIPDVINSLNDGTFAQKYQRAYDDGGINVSVQQSPDIRSLSNDVRLIREQGEQSSTFDANGNEIIRYKNLRRIIKS